MLVLHKLYRYTIKVLTYDYKPHPFLIVFQNPTIVGTTTSINLLKRTYMQCDTSFKLDIKIGNNVLYLDAQIDDKCRYYSINYKEYTILILNNGDSCEYVFYKKSSYSCTTQRCLCHAYKQYNVQEGELKQHKNLTQIREILRNLYKSTMHIRY